MRAATVSSGLRLLLTVSPDTLRKLAHVRTDLRGEFPQVPEEQVDGHVQAVAAELLVLARFDDYVPLLVRRHVRERLSAEALAH